MDTSSQELFNTPNPGNIITQPGVSSAMCPSDQTSSKMIQQVLDAHSDDEIMDDTAPSTQGEGTIASGDSSLGAEDRPDESESEEEEDASEDARQVRKNLETILNGDIDFKGAFSFHRTYSDAPGPGLCLSEVGTVGLPLSKREAEVVKTHCTQAPFGKGERTLVDKTVRDTWEMDANKVRCGNPRWSQFLDRVVREVCEVLGVNFMASRPRCELYKLLLYETGSHFLPHVDTEKQNGMFATIVVILPSEFTGGAAHLSHGGLSTVYDCSASSRYDTNVFAWYTDVTHEIKPITSGYRLALSFNLIHTTQTLRPALSMNKDLVLSLRGVLTTWKKDKGRNTPEKLVYLLDHTYSQASLGASALKGIDAHKVALLSSLAQDTGFRLGLASIECYKAGPADGGYDGSYNGFADVYDNDMTITSFVDLTGKFIRLGLDFDEENETIPEDLSDRVESGDPDHEDYEGYQGNCAGTLERWYRRTVLIIWPSWSNYAVLYAGEKGLPRALKDIEAISAQEKLTSKETDLIDFILLRSAENPAAAARAVTQIALKQNNARLWNRAVKACCAHKGLAILSEDDICSAISHFGLQAIQSGLEEMLLKDPHNSTRLQFLDHLQEWVTASPDEAPEKAALRHWIFENVLKTLKTLKKPQQSEEQLLLSVAKAHGGITFLKDCLMPQLISLAAPDFLRQLAVAIHASVEFSASDSKTRSEVEVQFLAAAIAKEDFVAAHDPYAFNRITRAPEKDFWAITKLYVQTTRDLGQPHLIDSIIDRVMNIGNLDALEAQNHSRKVMTPLVVSLAESSQLPTGVTLPPYFSRLQRESIRLQLEWLSTHVYSFTHNIELVKSLFDTVLATRNADLFITSVWPRLSSMDLNESGLQLVIEQLIAKRDRFVLSAGVAGPSVDSMIETLSKRVASRIALQSPEQVIGALDWSLTMNAPQLSDEILAQLFRPTALSPNSIEKILVPLLPKLRTWGNQNHRDINPILQKIVTIWMDNILGAVPAAKPALANQLAVLSKWTCNCSPCSSARTFLTGSDQKQTTLYRIGAPSKQHVEAFLSSHARGLATCCLVRTTPQSLEITKSDAACQLIRWRKNQTKGVALLKTLSTDEDELRRMLGSVYVRVKSALAGRPASQTNAPPVQSRPPAAALGKRAGPSTSTTAQTRTVPQQSAASGSATTGPPAKKRKVIADVIDLT